MAAMNTFTLLCLLLASFFCIANASNNMDHPAVTCGSAIKLRLAGAGIPKKYLLYDSEGKNQRGGSGQHLATWVSDDPSSHRSMWWVRPAYHGQEKTEYPQRNDQPTCQAVAQAVKCGDIIRLTNVGTSRMLHSHNVQSPLSKQQEVSIFEGDDSGNNFKVECQHPNDQLWRRGESVHLLHVDTGKYVGGSKDAEFNVKTCGQNCPLMNNLEAFGRGAKDALGLIQAEQGIYLHI